MVISVVVFTNAPVTRPENVADDVSRGLHVKQLTRKWMNGPEFQKLPEEQWPVQTAAVQRGDMGAVCKN